MAATEAQLTEATAALPTAVTLELPAMVEVHLVVLVARVVVLPLFSIRQLLEIPVVTAALAALAV
jgi:hypothetical protein